MRAIFAAVLIGAGVVLAGCVRDVNLAEDVDLLIPSGMPQVKGQQQYQQNQGAPMNNQQQPPQQQPQQQPPQQRPPEPQQSTEPATVIDQQTEILIDLTTSKGVVRLKLSPADAPKTVQNFLTKAKSGYYQGLKFHRVEDWVVQGGDPLGNGTGGGKMPTELSQTPFKIGSLGVARGGDINVSNDSQFFICTKDCSWLTGQYTNFGEVVTGMEIVNQIAIGDTIESVVEVK